jgi:hypothetical protein
MVRYKLAIPVAVALLLGVAQAYFLIFCWTYVATYSPLLPWLISHGFRGAALHAVVYPVDFLTSVLLSVPAALVLVKLRPARLWLYLVFAVVPAFIWLNRDAAGDQLFAASWALSILNFATELLALPVAAVLLRSVFNTGAPNNSFKPNPLRSFKTPSGFTGGSA